MDQLRNDISRMSRNSSAQAADAQSVGNSGDLQADDPGDDQVSSDLEDIEQDQDNLLDGLNGDQRKMHSKYVLVVAALVLCLASLSFAQQGTSHAGTWAGKTGQLTIKTPVRVENTVLPAGNYEVKRVNMSDRHFVEFTRVVEVPNPAYRVRRR